MKTTVEMIVTTMDGDRQVRRMVVQMEMDHIPSAEDAAIECAARFRQAGEKLRLTA